MKTLTLKNGMAVLISFILLLGSFMNVNFIATLEAQTWGLIVGVEVGYAANYTFRCMWESNPPQPKPDFLLHLENISYQNVEVTAIYQEIVTVSITNFFKNGTTQKITSMGNLLTGKGNLSFQIIPARLTKGDIIPSPREYYVINDTIRCNYAGADRMINIVRIESGSPYGNWTVTQLYWDQETGFLCELEWINQTLTQTSFSKWYISTKMIATNIWEPTSGAWIIWMATTTTIAIIVVIIVFLFIQKRKEAKHRKLRRLRRRALRHKAR